MRQLCAAGAKRRAEAFIHRIVTAFCRVCSYAYAMTGLVTWKKRFLIIKNRNFTSRKMLPYCINEKYFEAKRSQIPGKEEQETAVL